MKKLMWEYLDGAYPNVYYKNTDFRRVLLNNDTFMNVRYIVGIHEKLVALFGCSPDIADNVLSSWLDSRPVYSTIPNATNPDVLIQVD